MPPMHSLQELRTLPNELLVVLNSAPRSLTGPPLVLLPVAPPRPYYRVCEQHRLSATCESIARATGD